MWRVGNGLVTCLTYIKQMIWPARLAVFYPHPGHTLPVWEIGLAIVLLLVVMQERSRCGANGPILYRLVLVSNNASAGNWIDTGRLARARRSIHLFAQIGLYMLLAWAITDALASRFQRRILGVTASVAIIVLAWCAHIQASYWRNGESLWSHASP